MWSSVKYTSSIDEWKNQTEQKTEMRKFKLLADIIMPGIISCVQSSLKGTWTHINYMLIILAVKIYDFAS